MKKLNKIETLTLTDEALDKAVKLHGTEYDRRRKIPEDDRTSMMRMFNRGKTIEDIMSKFTYNLGTIKYIVDEEYRNAFNLARKGKYIYPKKTNKAAIRERIAYKRKLVAEGALSAVIA